MIRALEAVGEIEALCVGSPFGCQLLSLAQGYGTKRPFAQFFTDGAAAYALLDGVLRVAGSIADSAEARAFALALGAAEAVCSAENAEALGLSVTGGGAVLEKHVTGEAEPCEASPPREVYGVLSAAGLVGAFEPFYLDLSHRMRHGTAAAFAVEHGGKAAAAAVAVFGKSGREALLSAVAVLPQLQGQGLGRAVVQKAERALSPRRLFVLREENKNERFYASLGFSPCGAWRAGKVNG